MYKAFFTMEKHFRLLKILIALTVLFSIHTVSLAQPPPPTQHGTSGDAPPGGGAPIGEGMFLLIGMAGLYGGKKVYGLRKTLKIKEL